MKKDAIRDKVAVVGAGCCKFGENWDKDPQDMIVEAAYEAWGRRIAYSEDRGEAEDER